MILNTYTLSTLMYMSNKINYKQNQVQFATKHNYESTVRATQEYLTYARGNKLNLGWSKLLLDVMNNNAQSELAGQLKPSLFYI